MSWNRARVLLVACIVVASATLHAQAGGCVDGSCGAAAPIADGCAPAAPAYRTIRVTELVPQQYTATRTVYRTEYRNETYTAYRTEYTQEQRTRTYTVNRMVPEVRTGTRTICVNVPVCEERVCYETRTVRKPVTKMVRKCVDQGHWECQCVEYKTIGDRLSGLFGSKCCDPCDPCCCKPVHTKMVKKWVPCKVWIECPVTVCEKVCETVPVVKKVHTCRKEYRTETFTYTVCKCVPEVKTECYTVCVPKCVPYTATKCVAVCVPHCETYTACKMVPVCVEKQVPICCDPCAVCCKKSFWSR